MLCHDRPARPRTTQVEGPRAEVAGAQKLFPYSNTAVIIGPSHMIFWSQCIKKLQDVNEDSIKFPLPVPPQAAATVSCLEQWGVY